jgi:SiaC family regulatory phosphoprotein
MQALLIESTDDSPKVILDSQSQVFLFEGESRPQHAFNFFHPIIQWIEEYGKVLYWQREHFAENKRLIFQFKLSYFNSTSAKFIRDILLVLNSFCKDGQVIVVRWFYYKEDTDMKESAEEYMKMLDKLPVELVVIEDSAL